MTSRKDPTPSVGGPGRLAKRHDLETPQTPPQHGSDLQQGDTQLFKEGQQIAPITPSQRRGAPRQGAGAPAPQQTSQFPNPLDFAGERLGGTASMEADTPRQRIIDVDPRRFMPIVKTLATSPGGGGTITQAYIEQLRRIANSPQGSPSVRVVDLGPVDEALERLLESGE